MCVCVACTYSRDLILRYILILSAIKMVPLMQFSTLVFIVISKERYDFQVLHTWGNLRTAICVVLFKQQSHVFFSSNSQNNLQTAGLMHFLLWYIRPVLTFKREAMMLLGNFLNEDAYRFLWDSYMLSLVPRLLSCVHLSVFQFQPTSMSHSLKVRLNSAIIARSGKSAS